MYGLAVLPVYQDFGIGPSLSDLSWRGSEIPALCRLLGLKGLTFLLRRDGGGSARCPRGAHVRILGGLATVRRRLEFSSSLVEFRTPC